MSDAVYPVLPGLAWSVYKKATFVTDVQTADSGREYAVGKRLYPVWTFRLSYEFLRAYGTYTELQTLLGFILQRRGRFDDFLYRDPNDYSCTQQAIGIGDGVTRVFPLVRNLGGAVEPLGAVDSIVHLRLDGVDVPFGGGVNQFNIDVGAPNVQAVVFGTPPPEGQVIDWTGTYYFRCRFTSDEPADFEEFVQKIHKPGAIEFRAPRSERS